MEPINTKLSKLEKYIINFDFASLYSSIMVSGSDPEEKTPTFNEPRLNPIKP